MDLITIAVLTGAVLVVVLVVIAVIAAIVLAPAVRRSLAEREASILPAAAPDRDDEAGRP